MKFLKLVGPVALILLLGTYTCTYIIPENKVAEKEKIDKLFEGDKEKIEEVALWNKFVSEITEIAQETSFPVKFGGAMELTAMVAEVDELVYYLRAKEHYRPGEQHGITIRDGYIMLKKTIENEVCKRPYSALPISVKFKISVTEKGYNPADLVVLTMDVEKACDD